MTGTASTASATPCSLFEISWGWQGREARRWCGDGDDAIPAAALGGAVGFGDERGEHQDLGGALAPSPHVGPEPPTPPLHPKLPAMRRALQQQSVCRLLPIANHHAQPVGKIGDRLRVFQGALDLIRQAH